MSAGNPEAFERIRAAMDGPWVTPGLFWGLLVLGLAGDGCYRLLRCAGILPGGSRARQSAASRMHGARQGPTAVAAEERAPGRLEQGGLRVLLALAVLPWICILLDLTGIPITRATLTLWATALFGAGWILERGHPLRVRPAGTAPSEAGSDQAERGPADADGPAAVPARAPRFRVMDVSLVRSPAALLLALATASLVVFSVVHIRFVPERSYDALVGFDLVGKVLAYEGRLRSTVFSRLAFNAQCTYAPLTATNDGFWYLFDAAVPRLWMPILTAGFLAAVWPRLREWTGSPTAAGLATFLMFLPSSFAYQLTEAQTDMPSMAFTALAAFSMVDLLRRREGYGPTALFLLAATTSRSENLVFGIGTTMLVLLRRLPGRWRSLWFTVLPGAFFLLWNLGIVKGLVGYDPGEQFRRSIDIDPARMAEVLHRAVSIIAAPAFFGEFAWMIAFIPLLWLLGRWKSLRRRVAAGPDPGVPPGDTTGTLLLVLGVYFVFYMPFFYMWNPALIPLWTMEHTFKRGFLRFIPGLTAAFVCSPPVLWAVRQCDLADDRQGQIGPNRRGFRPAPGASAARR